MEKLKMHTPNLTAENVEKLAALFPNCVTEAKDDKTGHLKRAIDFDQLRQELSDHVVDGPRERYHIDWPGKREALLVANAPIAKTLRPCREQSVDFDTTKNLFIEGDNLDALKLLQETYLGKVKMIYIDPPYNTGKDFLYNDVFATSVQEYFDRSNQKDGVHGQLVANLESNGRIHSDWLSMMYPRLKLARNLLKDDGVIAISLDDHEVANTRRICDEIFGERNFIALITIETDSRIRQYDAIGVTHEYLLLFSKTEGVAFNILSDDTKQFQFEDAEGGFDIYELRNRNIAFNAENRPNLHYPFWVNPESPDQNGFHQVSLDESPGWIKTFPQESQGVKTVWRWGKDKVRKNLNTTIVARKHISGTFQVIKKYRGATYSYSSVWTDKEVKTDKGTLQIKALFDNKKVFDHPKPIALVRRVLEVFVDDNGIVLDFFAGSGTTAHAVMALNEEDGGSRSFMLVQLPENCAENAVAAKEGFETIADLCRTRVQRAGARIKSENTANGLNLDAGFRAFKVDTSNMKNVYYAPDEVRQEQLALHSDNIKEDRTPEDLLFQVLVDWGVDLALPVTQETIAEKTVFFVDGNALAACFDPNISEDLVKELARRKPIRAVFRDSSYDSDSTKINVEQIFKLVSPETEVKSL